MPEHSWRYSVSEQTWYVVTERDEQDTAIQTWKFSTYTAAYKFIRDMREANNA